ncbi:MAG: hemolysin family protein, partial [Anaerolineae bacterium]|nr:hemolysin family protein [Anaerolineae bacterium]
AYTALTNARRTPLREQSERGDAKASRILQVADDLLRLSMTRRIFLTLVRFALVAVASVSVAEPLIRAEDAMGVFLVPELGYIAVLLPVALITYIFGDLVPTTLGQPYADQLAPIVSMPMRALVLIFSPLVALFMSISRTLARASGAEDMAKAVTEEEIMSLVDVGQQGGAIEVDEKEMIYSVLQFGETLAREVMVPRPDVTAVEINEPLTSTVKMFMDTGHSRLPVFEEAIDNVKGLLYAKDLLKLLVDGQLTQRSIRDMLRPAYFVPETKRADTLFEEMQDRKVHLAVVVDEYGGTAGIVTIEDLVEEIVGDIKDEYDVNEEAEYTQVGVGEYVVDGAMNLDDLNELLDSDLPTDENDSVGGYVYSKLGHVPDVGEMIEEPTLLMRVDAVENRRIRKVYIAKRTPPPEEGEGSESDEAAQDAPPVETAIQPKTAS